MLTRYKFKSQANENDMFSASFREDVFGPVRQLTLVGIVPLRTPVAGPYPLIVVNRLATVRLQRKINQSIGVSQPDRVIP